MWAASWKRGSIIEKMGLQNYENFDRFWNLLCSDFVVN